MVVTGREQCLRFASPLIGLVEPLLWVESGSPSLSEKSGVVIWQAGIRAEGGRVASRAFSTATAHDSGREN